MQPSQTCKVRNGENKSLICQVCSPDVSLLLYLTENYPSVCFLYFFPKKMSVFLRFSFNVEYTVLEESAGCKF